MRMAVFYSTAVADCCACNWQKLSSAQLQEYQEMGFLDISDTRLEGTDLKLIYTFDNQSAGDTAQADYEPSSDNEVSRQLTL